MESTVNLDLPYIMPSQAQKHVTHNEALELLDALVQCVVIDRDLSSAPGGAQEGDRYIVAAGAGGEWEGHEGSIAVRRDGGWRFLAPGAGWRAWAIDEAALLYWTGSAWQSAAAGAGDLQNLSRLGVGATADAQNPFSAKLNNALWAALTTGEGGTGNLRYVMNKEAPSGVLSLLMQSNWSGRAEIGLVGDDDLTIKVSPDAIGWSEALRIDRHTAKVSFAATNVLTDYAISLLPDSGRFAGNAAKAVTIDSFSFPSYITLQNGTTTSDAGKFIHDNTDYGGTAGTLPAVVKNLVDKIRSVDHRRYGSEFRVAQLTMGSGTNFAQTVGSTPYYMCAYLAFGPRAPAMTFHAYLRALDAPVLYHRYDGQTIIKNGTHHETHVSIAPEDGWVSVTVVDQVDPYFSVGYNPTPMTIRCSSVGHRLLLACPALMGGIAKVNDNVGVIAGINRWLP